MRFRTQRFRRFLSFVQTLEFQRVLERLVDLRALGKLHVRLNSGAHPSKEGVAYEDREGRTGLC